VNPWDPLEQTADVLAAPSQAHWLGTDSLGRDVVARLIYGLRVSLSYGLLFWLTCFLIGISVGCIQGYFAGKIDFITERFKELIEILPFLSVVILVNGLMKSDSFFMTLIVVVLFSWVGIASQLRAQVLSLRNREFCEAARAAGAGNLRIIFSHVLPNALTPILTLTPFTVSGGITTLAVLDYLGFGLSPPTPSLGELLQQGRSNIQNASWLLISPTLALSWMLISINLIGESLREAFDPRK
jgi:microcin C transport system permease protein